MDNNTIPIYLFIHSFSTAKYKKISTKYLQSLKKYKFFDFFALIIIANNKAKVIGKKKKNFKIRK